MYTRMPAMAAVLGISVFAAPVSAATYTYNLLDSPQVADASLDYGIRLDDYGMVFSFENGASAQLVYDDVANTATISGTIRESFSEPGRENWHQFRDIWDISFTMTDVTNTGTGLFADYAGNGTGYIKYGDTNLTLGMPMANGGAGYFFIRDGGYAQPGDVGFGGAGWMDPDPSLNVTNTTNDFLFTAELSSVIPTPMEPVPLPAAGLLLLSGIMGLGAMSRRRRRL